VLCPRMAPCGVGHHRRCLKAPFSFLELQAIAAHDPVKSVESIVEHAIIRFSRLPYKDFLTLWKDADPDIPILKQAKAEYAKLQ
jgi:hypothetical protein